MVANVQPDPHQSHPHAGQKDLLSKLKLRLRCKCLGSATAEEEELPATPRTPSTEWLADINSVGTPPPESPIVSEAGLDVPTTPRSPFVAWLADPKPRYTAPAGSPARHTQYVVGTWHIANPMPVPKEPLPAWKMKLQVSLHSSEL